MLRLPHVNMDEGGGGVQTLCPLHHLPHKPAPRAGGLLHLVRAAGEGLKVGEGVSGWVGKATMLREGHCKRNQSCTWGQKHGKVLNLKNIAHIRAIFVQFSREWELYANADETCSRQCEYARQFNKNLPI